MQKITDNSDELSFHQLTSTSSVLRIPLFQRPYVWTKKQLERMLSEVEAIANEEDVSRFLGAIIAVTRPTNPSQPTPHEIVDGQQRLTTLFLLHWYIANKEGKYEDYRRLLVDEKGKVKFSYETRSSSKEFCEGLITSGIDFKHYNSDGSSYQNKLSAAIQDSQWYFLSWQNDPTVKSMLIMLDEIHKLLHGKGNGYYSSLVDKDNP